MNSKMSDIARRVYHDLSWALTNFNALLYTEYESHIAVSDSSKLIVLYHNSLVTATAGAIQDELEERTRNASV